MNNPMLIFIDAADDAAAYPLSRLLGMTVAADATILMKFEGSAADTTVEEDNIDLVTITCTSDKELQVMKSISVAIAGAQANLGLGYTVIADDVNSTYVDSAITGIAITLDT